MRVNFKVAITFLSFFVLLLPASWSLKGASSAFPQKSVIKSPTDKRDYKFLVLSNQLEVLLVSDPSTDQAAASLNVHVGQMNDPDDRQGLAHFNEHMLFLGNKKFPDANEYGDYLSSHGGISNAYTSLEDTNYFFSVHKDYLKGALARFSQFFISPTFNEKFVEREINAVNSEHQKNIKNDERRIYRILRSTANPKHPFHKFGTGNLETLRFDNNNKQLRNQLISFYGKYYSADLMKLVIIGKESLPELESIIREYFSEIKSKKTKEEAFDSVAVIDADLPRKISIKPIKTIRQLRLMFPVPSQKKYYKNKPAEVLSQLLGDEGTGSILAYLRKKGWATNLSAGGGSSYSDFSFVTLSITLTPSGLGKVTEITEIVFRYIELLKQEKSLSRYFVELKKMAAIGFQFREKESPMGYARSLAADFPYVCGENLVASRWIYEKYEPDLVKNLLKYLVVDNLQLVLIAPDVSVDKTEKWYGVRYGVEKVQPGNADIWRNPKDIPGLGLPPENPFIPGKITLKPVLSKEMYPILLKDSDRMRIWFKQDDNFRVPKGNIRIQLSSPKAYSSVKNAAMAKLMVLILRENLNEYSYPAALAGLHYSLSSSVRGIDLSLGGYSENIHLLFQKIVKSMNEFKVDSKHFGIFKNQMLEKRKNQKFSPAYQRTSYEAFYLLSETLWHTDEYIDVIDSITMKELEAFVPDLLSQMYIEVFAHGNFSAGETLELGKWLEKSFSSPSRKPVPIVEERTLKIPPATMLTYQVQIEDVNSAVQVYYQVGPHNIKQGVILDMIQQIIEKPFYHRLRTLEQLGYIVWSGYSRINKVDGFNFIIQSNTKEPVYLKQRIDKFIMDFDQTIKNLSKEEFNQYRKILISKRLEKPKNLGEETSWHWGVIASRDYDFRYQEVEVEALRRLKLKDLLSGYDRLFNSMDQKKVLTVQAVGKNHKRKKPTGRLIENKKEFKSKMRFYKNTAGDIQTSVIRN